VLPLVVAAYRRDAEAGDPVAQYSVSQLYAAGAGVAKDGSQAHAWARKAAEAGNALGALMVGMQYETGDSVAKDLGEAYRWYRKAAEGGDPTAQYNVGVCLRDGRGVAQDKKAALEWFRKAADNDVSWAASALASAYDRGDVVEKDTATALRWLERAAELGDPKAQIYLGNRYTWGIGGVASDIKKAVALYQKAAPWLKAEREEQVRKSMVQAQAAIEEKNFADAQRLLQQARDLAPWSEAAWYNMALVLGETGNYAEAIREMQVFLTLAPSSPQARGAQDMIYRWERKVPK